MQEVVGEDQLVIMVQIYLEPVVMAEEGMEFLVQILVIMEQQIQEEEPEVHLLTKVQVFHL